MYTNDIYNMTLNLGVNFVEEEIQFLMTQKVIQHRSEFGARKRLITYLRGQVSFYVRGEGVTWSHIFSED